MGLRIETGMVLSKSGLMRYQYFKGHRYLTCVYQIDKGMRRLLWCGKDRKAKTLLRFFRDFGKERCDKLQFVWLCP